MRRASACGTHYQLKEIGTPTWQNAAIAAAAPVTYAAALFRKEAPRMIPPLDPVVAQIIPLLPLRDPTNMTPQSARDALRALAASRAAFRRRRWRARKTSR